MARTKTWVVLVVMTVLGWYQTAAVLVSSAPGVCTETREVTVNVTRNVNDTCLRKDVTACGFLDLFDCTKWRNYSCIQLKTVEELINVTRAVCCEGWTDEGDGICILIGPEPDTVTSTAPAEDNWTTSARQPLDKDSVVESREVTTGLLLFAAEDSSSASTLVITAALGGAVLVSIIVIGVLVFILWRRKEKGQRKNAPYRSKDNHYEKHAQADLPADIPRWRSRQISVGGSSKHSSGTSIVGHVTVSDGNAIRFTKSKSGSTSSVNELSPPLQSPAGKTSLTRGGNALPSGDRARDEPHESRAGRDTAAGLLLRQGDVKSDVLFEQQHSSLLTDARYESIHVRQDEKSQYSLGRDLQAGAQAGNNTNWGVDIDVDDDVAAQQHPVRIRESSWKAPDCSDDITYANIECQSPVYYQIEERTSQFPNLVPHPTVSESSASSATLGDNLHYEPLPLPIADAYSTYVNVPNLPSAQEATSPSLYAEISEQNGLFSDRLVAPSDVPNVSTSSMTIEDNALYYGYTDGEEAGSVFGSSTGSLSESPDVDGKQAVSREGPPEPPMYSSVNKLKKGNHVQVPMDEPTHVSFDVIDDEIQGPVASTADEAVRQTTALSTQDAKDDKMSKGKDVAQAASTSHEHGAAKNSGAVTSSSDTVGKSRFSKTTIGAAHEDSHRSVIPQESTVADSPDGASRLHDVHSLEGATALPNIPKSLAGVSITAKSAESTA